MAVTERSISALINRQLPEFVRADHPQFKRFLELYYEWLEDESRGNTVYHIMNSGKYRDIDETIDPFIRLFKQELLPYFPERSELDLVKILKGAREFYVKKGSEESVKWLFRVLYGQDVQIYFPKKQILIASDGKWKLPQAFQLTLSAANQSIDPNLLEKHKGTGTISKATAIIESANKTVDRVFGNEILELYVSNVSREFTSGENLEIPYTDGNGVEQLFVEKIIGSISGIKIDAPQGDATSPRRGLSYNVGDPVIVFGGLATSSEANDAVGVVGNVTQGSVESLSVAFPGYGYRVWSNTIVTIYRDIVADDPNSNTSTNVRVTGITTANATVNTNARFVEHIVIDKMPIEYAKTQVLSNTGDWTLFSTNNRNMSVTLSGTPGSGSDKWHQYEDFYADSNGSYQTANITGKILTSNSGWAGGPATITFYNVANTNNRPLDLLVGNTVNTVNSIKSYTVNAILDESLSVNANSMMVQMLNFERIETGGVSLYQVYNGGAGFNRVPTAGTESYHDTYWSEAERSANGVNSAAYANTRQLMGATGQIAHVYITNPGDGYANGDAITVIGSGYNFAGYVNVNPSGGIIATTITNRGEGYYGALSATITSGAGANAVLTPYGFGKGVVAVVANSAIGRVRDIRLVSRGFDYISTPNVSLKIVDMVIDGIADLEDLNEGERVFQGATLETAIFQGIVKNYNRSTKALRLYNYSGNSFSNFNKTLTFTSEGGVKFNVNTSALVSTPPDYTVQGTLNNPHFYGNGKAKGIAEFFNGLIKFTGFFLNSDGFLSSDKKLQDMNVYHNYSYVIESEKSLAEYENVMKDVVHPVGMVMLSRTISKSELDENISSESSISVGPALPLASNISVANSLANVVTGNATNFTANASVGDMIYLKANNGPGIPSGRSQVKVIEVIDSATQLKVQGDFTYMGEGKIVLIESSTSANVFSNTNPVNEWLAIGDEVHWNGFDGNSYSTKTGTVSITGGSNVVTGLTTTFNTDAVAGSWIKVNNEIRLVETVTSDLSLQVNTAFVNDASGVAYSRRDTLLKKKINNIQGNVLTLNTSANGTCTVMFRVVPDYKTINYAYEIIKVAQ
jgi:hypothetical protein